MVHLELCIREGGGVKTTGREFQRKRSHYQYEVIHVHVYVLKDLKGE